MRSWLGYVSPYVRSLEEQLVELKRERATLLDRLLLMTTGYPMKLPEAAVEAAAEQAKSAVSKIAQKIIDEPTGNYMTMAQLMADLEGTSFREDAQIEANTEAAAMDAHNQEVDAEARARNVALRQVELARKQADADYESKMKPIER